MPEDNDATTASLIQSLILDGYDVQYLLSPGNAGDALINVGFFHLADELGLVHEVISDPMATRPGAAVVVGGGGGLVPEWDHTAAALSAVIPRAARVIVLPHTIRGHESLLESLDDRVTVFTREQVSFEHVQAHIGQGVSHYLDHDMAFHVDLNRLLSRKLREIWPIPRPMPPKELVRRLAYHYLWARGWFSPSVRAMRVDAEAARDRPPFAVVHDISLMAYFGSSSRLECEGTAALFLRLLNRFEEITTDRLHVAIGAALLGKRVTLHDNNSYKCRAVYEHSLASWGVQMVP